MKTPVKKKTGNNRITQIAAIEELCKYDHAFISPEGVKRFTAPFGFQGRISVYKTNPNQPKGLILNGGGKEAEGQDAMILAI
jgi:hypothetical protein